MDLITQGIVGAAMAQSARVKPVHIGAATVCGFVGGLAPDLDALIRSPTDPLVFLEFHRHFTHALPFIPIGGAICGLLLFAIAGKRWNVTLWPMVLFCTLGYATHGILDAMTSYGTSLFWPFSAARVSWSLVSIVDPLFTVPIALMVALSWLKQHPAFARAALFWAVIYLGFAASQHTQALRVAESVAADRGHAPGRVAVKPSFGNTLVWRSIYEADEAFYVDAIRTGLSPRVYDGVSVSKLVPNRDLPWLDPQSQQAQDLERFRFFSRGYIARDPARPNRIIDIRYAFVPNTLDALWSVEVSPSASPSEHVRYLTHRENARANLGVLWGMIVNE